MRTSSRASAGGCRRGLRGTRGQCRPSLVAVGLARIVRSARRQKCGAARVGTFTPTQQRHGAHPGGAHVHGEWRRERRHPCCCAARCRVWRQRLASSAPTASAASTRRTHGASGRGASVQCLTPPSRTPPRPFYADHTDSMIRAHHTRSFLLGHVVSLLCSGASAWAKTALSWRGGHAERTCRERSQGTESPWQAAPHPHMGYAMSWLACFLCSVPCVVNLAWHCTAP